MPLVRDDNMPVVRGDNFTDGGGEVALLCREPLPEISHERPLNVLFIKITSGIGLTF